MEYTQSYTRSTNGVKGLDHFSTGAKNDGVQLLKYGIWLYFILLIIEGALRKWVVPSLSQPLLIVRDPVAIALLLYAWYKNIFPHVSYVVWMISIASISLFTSLFIGHGNIAVTLFGARILLVHFPLIFLIGKVFNKTDVIKVGKVVLWISIPMAILIALQFFSSQHSWVNRSVGGGDGGGFSGAMGYFRPPGTFSFTNGTTLFFGLAGSYIFYFWLKIEQIYKPLLLAATVALLIAIPLSISRGLSFRVVIVLIFMVLTLTRNPKFIGKMIVSIIGFGMLITLLAQTGFLETPIEVFLQRFENAGKSEGGIEGTLINRYLGGMVKAIAGSSELPFFGVGMGMGTNVGGVLLSGGRTFLVSEGEWGRLIGEMGALFGIAVIFIRLAISFKVALKSYSELKNGYVLAWMLLSSALLIFPQGQWAQPTTLGFSTLIMGLLIAAFNHPPKPKADLSGITEQSNKIPERT